MIKAILMSIQPKWLVKILNGEKTIDIRKTMPKCELPIDVYLYCTKDKKYANLINRGGFLTGMVVAKFTLNKVEIIRPIALGSFLKTSTLEHKEIIDKSCLTENEIRRYLTNMYGYAWHISNLVIFDKPMELSNFYKDGGHLIGNGYTEYLPPERIAKAPQSWQYTWLREYKMSQV